MSQSTDAFMAMFGFVFGIPLSLTAPISGVTLGLGSKWGVLRYPWVPTKLVLLVTTILSGALFVGRLSEQVADGAGAYEAELVVAAAYNVVRAHGVDGAVDLQVRPAAASGRVLLEPGARRDARLLGDRGHVRVGRGKRDDAEHDEGADDRLARVDRV